MPEADARAARSAARAAAPSQMADGARARAGERARPRRAVRRCSRVHRHCCSGRSSSPCCYKLLVYFRGVPELGPLPRRQAARDDPDRLLLDPAAVEHHHGAVELLPRARSRPARRRAGRLAASCTARSCSRRGVNSSWMVVLMAVPMFAAFGVGVRRRLARSRCSCSVVVHAVPHRAGGDRQRDHAAPRERLPRAAHARHPQRDRGARGGRHRAAVPHRAPGAARASGGIPLARGLRHGAAHADVAVPAERVGAARGDVVAERAPGIRCPCTCCGRTAAAAFVLGALLHRQLYAIGFSKAQESGERWARGGAMRRDSATRCSRRSASCGASWC